MHLMHAEWSDIVFLYSELIILNFRKVKNIIIMFKEHLFLKYLSIILLKDLILGSIDYNKI